MIRPHTHINALRPLLVAAGLLLLFGSCQSPIETAPTVPRTVTVHVQDATGRAIELIPVEVYDLTISPEQRTVLEKDITDRNGNTVFRFPIPTTGAAFRFVVGNENTGTTTLDANLLCRDTLMVVTLATDDLPCGGTYDRTIRIEDVCAPLTSGETFSDSSQIVFRSGCDVPLTFTVTGPQNSPALTLHVIGENGEVIADRPFELEAMGQFAIRAVATPQDSGLQVTQYQIVGTGANQAMVTINLTVEVLARNCNTCECPDDEIVIDFGEVQALPAGEGSEQNEVVPLRVNGCLYDRIDNIVKQLTLRGIFSVTPLENVPVSTGENSTVTVTFRPKERRFYADTVLVEHFIPEEARRCTTRIILVGRGCGPECRLVPSPQISETQENRYDFDMGRVRVYSRELEQICFENIGDCGVLTLNAAYTLAPGFTVVPDVLEIEGGETDCFTVLFDATDEVVWPNGHGQPAKTVHNMPLVVSNCGPRRDFQIQVVVDTLPILFSRCIYQWDQNEFFGYNFTPVVGKGEDRFDPDIPANQVTDFVVLSVIPGVEADVLIRSGWVHIRSNVTEDEFNFTDMSTGQNGWSIGEFRQITQGPFNTAPPATLEFRSVYSVRIERNGVLSYAAVRVRELSVDPDGKFKVCLDVLYPMIKEN